MASEPMSAERLSDLVRELAAAEDGVHSVRAVYLRDAIAEIDRLRAEVDRLSEDNINLAAGVAELERLRREPGPLVPDAPGWWWWREDATGRYEPVLIGAEDGSLWCEYARDVYPRSISHGEWGGRCEEPRR